MSEPDWEAARAMSSEARRDEWDGRHREAADGFYVLADYLEEYDVRDYARETRIRARKNHIVAWAQEKHPSWRVELHSVGLYSPGPPALTEDPQAQEAQERRFVVGRQGRSAKKVVLVEVDAAGRVSIVGWW